MTPRIHCCVVHLHLFANSVPQIQIQMKISVLGKKKKRSLLPTDVDNDSSVFKQLVSESGFSFADDSKEPNELCKYPFHRISSSFS